MRQTSGGEMREARLRGFNYVKKGDVGYSMFAKEC